MLNALNRMRLDGFLLSIILALTLTACGGGVNSDSRTTINGAGVKAPLAEAIVRLYQVDIAQTDLKGALLDEGHTGDDAAIRDLTITNDLSGLLLLEFIVDADTIEINTGKAPVFDRLLTVFDVQRVYAGDAIFASPLTTMAVELAWKKADKLSPYAGNNDGTITDAEFAAALGIAQNQLKSTLGFGLDTTIDIFVDPPMITSSTDTTAEQTRVVQYRQAIEALTAVTIRIANDSTANDTAQQILTALIDDLLDGDFDGNDGTAPVATLAALDTAIDTILTSVNLANLTIPGTFTPISDIENELVNETSTTGENTNTTELENGTITIDLAMPKLIADSDGDGVDDSLDAFPSDPAETADTDSDGVGDNADAFPTDPTETIDTDGDLIGDNTDTDDDNDTYADSIDAFPLDAAEWLDTDNDTIGNNADTDDDNDGVSDLADAFPLDDTETTDTDGDTVGDNRDAFPTDASLNSAFKPVIWVGPDDTLLEFSSDVDGIEFYRSTEENCDIANYAACSDGQLDYLTNNQQLVDTAFITSRTAYYSFKYGNGQTTFPVTTDNRLPETLIPRAIEFKGRLWFYTNTLITGNIYSSVDGATWIQHSSSQMPLPDGRREYELVSFKDKLWILAGNSGGDLNDVWSSDDGINWTEVEAADPTTVQKFTVGKSYRAAVFNDKLWMIGGWDNSTATSIKEIWSSPDGIDWTLELSGEAFLEGTGYEIEIFNDRMWMLRNDGEVWSSSNGVDWEQALVATPYTPRIWSSASVFEGKLWLIGGLDSDYLNDVWSSPDGINWTQETSNADFSRRYHHVSLVFNNKLFVLGGSNDLEYHQDVWSSTDGINWMQNTTGAGFSGRDYHASASFAGKLWVIGGHLYDEKNDVWSSADGLDWTRELANAPFDARAGHEAAVYNNKLWVIGGMYKSDVWASSDGVDWEQKASSAPFGNRIHFTATAAFGRLWIVGGYDYDTSSAVNEIWSSADGVTWEQSVPQGTMFSPRYEHQSAYFNNRLWVWGGTDGSNNYKEIWWTDDGINWTQEFTATEFPTFPIATGVYDNKVWLIIENGKTWSSDDGIDWVQTGNKGITATEKPQVIVHNNTYYRIGGASKSTSNKVNDVWSSTDDGATWRKGYALDIQF